MRQKESIKIERVILGNCWNGESLKNSVVIGDGCKVEANLKVGDASDWIPHGYIS